MAAKRLTDKSIAAIRAPETGRTEVFDQIVTGLCHRVTSTGARSWSTMYRFAGELRRDTIGPYPKIGLAQARKLARDALALVGQGKDPRKVAAAAEAAETVRKADTVAAVAEQFIAKHVAQRRWREWERILRRDVIPEWSDRPIAEITRRDVIELLDMIAERAPVQANRTLTVLTAFFGWALDRDIIQADPTARVRKPTKETPRERVLTDLELQAFWRGCDRLGWPYGPLLQLLALTAQRRGEIGDLTWSEIDVDERLVEIAGAKYKTGRPHLFPLSPAALAIIARLPRIGDLVFTGNGKVPVDGFAKAKTALDSLMLEELRRVAPEATLQPWVIHDLRRTARTNFSKLGIPGDIGERVLGHVVGGVRGIYDRHSFLPQMRDALDRWAAHLEGIVNPRPDKVVKLGRR